MGKVFAFASLFGLSAGLLFGHQQVHASPVIGSPCSIAWENDQPDQQGLCDTYTLGVGDENKVIYLGNEWMFRFLSRDKGNGFDVRQEDGKDVYTINHDRYGRASLTIDSM